MKKEGPSIIFDQATEGLIKKNFNLLVEFYIEEDVIVFINKQTISRMHELKTSNGKKTKDRI